MSFLSLKSSDYDMVNNKALLCGFFVFTVSIETETLCHHVVSVMSVTCLLVEKAIILKARFQTLFGSVWKFRESL